MASQITANLVQQISALGLSAASGSAATRPQLNDLVIQGSILSLQEGSAAKRVAIGFSAGQSEMKVAVEGFQMTANGLHKLGSGDVGSGGNKTPGSAVGLAALVATGNPAGLIDSTGMKVYGEKAAAIRWRAGPSRSPKKSVTCSRSGSSNRVGSIVPEGTREMKLVRSIGYRE